MIVRSSVNACCTSSQKSSSRATEAGTAPPAARKDSTKRRRVGMRSTSPKDTADEHGVGEQVHHQDAGAEHNLRRRREPRRVQHRHDVMLHEAARVPREPGPPPQVVLERGERADPAAVLDRERLAAAGDVRPDDPAPAPHDEPAHHDEHDESGVQQYDDVGERAIEHLQAWVIKRNPPQGQGPAGDLAEASGAQAPIKLPAGVNRPKIAVSLSAYTINTVASARRSSWESSLPSAWRARITFWSPVIRAYGTPSTWIVMLTVKAPVDSTSVIVPSTDTVSPPRVTLKLIERVASSGLELVIVSCSSTCTTGLSRSQTISIW